MGKGRTAEALFKSAGWMADARCCSCAELIPTGEDRIVIALFDLSLDWGTGARFAPELGPVSHWCMNCVQQVGEFRVRNPWRQPGFPVKWASTQLPQSKPVADSRLSKELATGNIAPFNAAFPADAKASDALANYVPLYSEPTCDVFDQGVPHTPDKQDRKVRLTEFLRSPKSRGMRPAMREAARRYANGADQTEIAKSMKVNQATVSRLLKSVFELMNRPR
jgi:hypothetical protein